MFLRGVLNILNNILNLKSFNKSVKIKRLIKEDNKYCIKQIKYNYKF